MEGLSFALLATLIGFGGGLVLGMANRLGDFCTLGAVESAFFGGNQRRARQWGVVLGTAILVTGIAARLGWAEVERTIYLTIAWDPLASIVGGLLFGYGMALAGNCGFGALARFGGGDIRGLVVAIVIGITAFMTLNGPLAPLRLALFAPRPIEAGELTPALPQAVESAFGIPALAVSVVVAVALLAWGLSHAGLRAELRRVVWGVLAGLAIASAFIGTSWLAHASLEEISILGHSYTVPIGRTILYLMTSSAGGLDFPIGSILGVVAGGAVGALLRGLFRWEACEDPRELGRNVAGAALMGVGGTIALGCSIGQGASAFAVLAFSAPVTLLSIVIGAVIGLRQLIAAGYAPE